MNPYQQFVSEYARLDREGRDYPLGKFPRCPRPQAAAGAPTALIFSPHPDDEVIIGGLALRLLRKSAWHVTNVAVTLGSKKERQSERLEELKACCDCIGFGLEQTAPTGLERVNLTTRQQDPAFWSNSVGAVSRILAQRRPRVIFVPHDADWNSSHVGTHYLVMDALAQQPAGFQCYVVVTEFWRPMEWPNLMVEVSQQELADLITALTFHVGEVKRNPYHLSLPAWMVDNVRRGGECVGGQGGAAPKFTFATLYGVFKWSDGRLDKAYPGGKFLATAENPASLFPG